MKASEVEVGDLPAGEYDAWRALVAESPDGSPYALPEYLDALCEATGGRFRVLAARVAGELLGGVPLYEEGRSRFAWVAPRLLLYYNGFVLRRSSTRYPSEQTARWVPTLAALGSALSGLGLSRCELRSRETVTDLRVLVSDGWTASPSWSYVVDIADTAAAWGKVEQNLRRLVGRAEREGIVFTRDDDSESLWRLHAGVADRKGGDLYLPRAAFLRFVERIVGRGLARLYHARLPDGRAIASQLVLASGHPVTHTVCAGSDPEHLRSGASTFLRWRALEALAGEGFRANDLTDAALNPVTHFKSQLGGALVSSLVVARPEASWVAARRRAQRVSRWLRRSTAGVLRRARAARNGK